MPESQKKNMSSLVSRGNLSDDFFRGVSPGFYVKPQHGDPLPNPAQIKLDVKENGNASTVSAEIPGVTKEAIQVSIDGNMVTMRVEVKPLDTQRQAAAQRALFRSGLAWLSVAAGHRPVASQGPIR